MSHPILELCDLMVDWINDPSRSWIGEFTAIKQVVPAFPIDPQLSDYFDEMRVIVSPLSIEGEDIDRGMNYFDTLAISIGFMQSLPAGIQYNSPEGTEWISERIDYIWNIMQSLRSDCIALEGSKDFKAGTFNHNVITSPARLESSSLLVSVISANFSTI